MTSRPKPTEENIGNMREFRAILDEKRAVVNKRIDELLAATGFEQSAATNL